ncbi:small ribosomal subunit protein mS29-like [Macrobrachium nipponense]|uniref:small ribosomal subunit protein mS29-like n=1 Tax=Macrobrachium nipponense TaxID=159736 RepID=UPI0030C84A54
MTFYITCTIFSGPVGGIQLIKNHGSSCYSTLAEVEGISAPRTFVQQPSLHTKDHLGLWYTIEPEVVKRLFGVGGLPKQYVKLCDTFRETSIMVRNPALTVIDLVKRSNLSMPPNKFLFYGRDGVGKTLSIAHVMHFLAEDGWVLIHIPWLPNWRRRFKEVNASTSNPGFFDHPIDASTWLQRFRHQNEEILKKLQLTTNEQYTWSRRESTEAGSPLSMLIEHGINRSRYATDAVMALTTELKKCATEGRCKVALVVDGINSFFCPVSRHKVDSVIVEPQRFMIYKAFMHLFNNDWKNGCILGSIDLRANSGETRDSYLPRYLLQKAGWEALDPFVPIPVEDYDEREMMSIIDYYIDRDWLQNINGPLKLARSELAALTGHNPYTVMRICSSL